MGGLSHYAVVNHHGDAAMQLPKYGGTFVQAEDEIAAASIAIGFSMRAVSRYWKFRTGNF